MWIEDLPNGKYKFCEQYTDNLTGQRRKVTVTLQKNTRETRNQAQKQLLAKIRKKQKIESKIIEHITFGKLSDEWFNIYSKQVRPNTILALKSNIKMLKSEIGTETIVDKITPAFLTKIFEGLMFIDNDISENYAKTLRSRLNNIFEFAINHGYLKENPVTSVRIPRKKKAAHLVSDFFLEQNELNSLMNYLKLHNYRYYLLCQWLYLNGLRFGEGSAMLKSDIKITDERQYCIVSGTLDYHGKKISDQVKSTETKTKDGMREVDLNSKAIEIYHEALRLSDNSDFLFTTINNTPIQANALNSFFREHKKDMGFEENKRISTHIFRHTHVSKLAELGVPLHMIQKRVGHANEGITRDIYLHITQAMKNETKNLLEKL